MTPADTTAMAPSSEQSSASLSEHGLGIGETAAELLRATSRFPNKIALIHDTLGDQTFWTYRELHTHSTKLAASVQDRLQRTSNDAPPVVAMLLQSSREMVLGVTAMLSIGVPWVAIHPSWPVDLMEYVLKDSGAALLIYDESCSDMGARKQLSSSLHQHSIHALVEVGGTRSGSLPRHVDDLCYITYTSGSTGRPKGVKISKQNLDAFLLGGAASIFSVGPSTRQLLVVHLAFDESIADILLCLLRGGTLVTANQEELLPNLAEYVRKWDVNFLYAVPSVAESLLDTDHASLRCLYTGGECLPRHFRKRLHGDISLLFGYGPCECTITVAASYVTLSTPDDQHALGDGLFGNQLFILNHDTRKPVTDGEVGSLFVSGAQVGLGYIGTDMANRFSHIVVPDCAGRVRVYDTGDDFVKTKQGLQFVGRRDRQVKLRGQRIDLSGIDAVVEGEASRLGLSLQVATVLRFNERESAALVCCLVLSEAQRQAARDELASVLAQKASTRLPEYAWPKLFTFLDAFPVIKTSGKRDMKALQRTIDALPLSSMQTSAQEEGDEAAECMLDDVESLVQEIFAKALGMNASLPSLTKDIFVLGGDSLTAMKISALLRKNGVKISAREVVRCGTISALVKHAKESSIIDHQRIPYRPFSLISPLPSDKSSRNLWLKDIVGPLGLTPADVEDVLPTTPAQAAMVASGLSKRAYISHSVFALRQATRVSEVEGAWQRMMEAYAILRTSFLVAGDGPTGVLQIVARPTAASKMIAIPLDGRVTVDEQDRACRQAIFLANRKQSGSLSTGAPEMRVIASTSGEAYRLLLSQHHASYDANSHAMLVEDLTLLLDGKTPDFQSRKPFHYYVRHLFQTQTNAEEQLDFWRRRLHGYIPPPSKLAIQTKESTGGDSGDSMSSTVMRKEWKGAIQTLASTIGVSPSEIVKCCVAWAIAKRTGGNDALFALVTAGRDIDATEDFSEIVGPTLNTTIFRSSFAPFASLVTLLRNSQVQSADQGPYERVSLQQLAADVLSKESFASLEVLLNCVHKTDHDTSRESALHELIDFDDSFRTPFPLGLEAVFESGSIIFTLQKSPAVPKNTAEWLLQHICETLTCLVSLSDPFKAQVDVLPTLSTSELSVYHQSGQGTLSKPLPTALLHELFEKAAKRYARKIAVQYEQDSWTSFRELDRHANALAMGLRRLDCSVVPFMVRRSTELIALLLAILKAGKAFCPFPIPCPPERARAMLAAIGSDVIVVTEDTKDLADSLGIHGLKTVSTAQLVTVEDAAGHTVDAARNSQDTAYVMFTSGTTGTPKGVAVKHSAIVSFLTDSLDIYQLDHTSRSIQLSQMVFDPSIAEIFHTLAKGSCLCLAADESLFGRGVHVLLSEMNITKAVLTPTLASLIPATYLPDMTVLAVGGEQMRADVITTWGSQALVINSYGPTETVICAVAKTITGEDVSTHCIGRPCGRMRAYVVDESGRPLPVGSVGELVIAGPQVSGYLQTDLESHVFLPDPLAGCVEDSTARMYRTGDLVRCDPDTLDFDCFGRIDSQIKVNGQRIEVEEIETVLLQSQMVKQVALLANAQGQLVACFVLTQGAGRKQTSSITLLDEPEAVKAAKELLMLSKLHLTDSWRPTFFLGVSCLPLMISGKLDRKAIAKWLAGLPNGSLQDALSLQREPNTQRIALTPVEHKLACIWQDVLKDNVHIDQGSNFRSLGGDSVRLVRLLSLLRKEGYNVGWTHLSQNLTLHDMAKLIEGHQGAFVTTPYQRFELLRLEEGKLNPFLETVLPEHYSLSQVVDCYPSLPMQSALLPVGHDNAAAYLLRRVITVRSEDDLSVLKSAVEAFYAKHEALRAIFVIPESHDHDFLQLIMDRDLPWTEQTCSNHQSREETIERVLSQQLKMDHSLVQWDVFRLEKEPNDIKIAWRISHALYDGHSLSMMADELRQTKPEKDKIVTLPSDLDARLATQYHSLVQKWFQDANREETLHFWKTEMSMLPLVEFPPLRGNKASYATREVGRVMNVPVAEFAQANGHTVAGILHAAVAIVLAAYEREREVCFGAICSSRGLEAGLEDVFGLCINTLPLTVSVESANTLDELLTHVQAKLDQLQVHGQISLNKVLAQSVRHGSQAIRTLFNYLGPLEGQLDDLGEEVPMHIGYPLVVEATLRGSSVYWTCQYDPSSLDEWEAEQLLIQIETVLLGFVASTPSSQLVEDIPLCSDKTVASLLECLSHSRKPVNCSERTLDEVIEEQVRKTPHKIAAQMESSEFVTYAELDARANRVANMLRTHKLGEKEEFVPLVLQRGTNMIVTLLGCLKAGVAYIPLDPEMPIARKRAVILPTKARLGLVSSKYRNELDGIVAVPLVVDEVDETQFSAERPARHHDSRRAAVCLTTSGSTSLPKVIVSEHRTLVSFLEHCTQIYSLSAASRMLQFSSYVWDVHVLDFFGPLMFGGTVCMAHRSSLLTELPAFCQEMAITTAFMTPSVARMLRQGALDDLQELMVGGEKMSETLRDFLIKERGVRLLNQWCPAEATVTAVSRPMQVGETRNIIGPPFGVNQVLCLDPKGRPVLGVPGELVIIGAQVARCYLGNAEATAKAFSADCFGSGEQMFRTGDRGKVLQDGSIEFYGRLDTQRKLRGQRLDMSEAEETLNCLSSVENVLVDLVSLPSARENQELVAVFVPRREGEVEAPSVMETLQDLALLELDASVSKAISSMRKAVQLSLATHSCPTMFIAVQALPYTASGKTDRRRVSASLEHLTLDLERRLRTLHTRVVKLPNGLLEEMLVNLWSIVLSCPAISVSTDDRFVDLGGDSIKAIRLVGLVRKRGWKFSVEDLMEARTIERQAKLLSSASSTSTYTRKRYERFELIGAQLMPAVLCERLEGIHPFTPNAIEDAYPALPLQVGLLSLSLVNPKLYWMNKSFLCPGRLPSDVFKAFDRLVSLHSSLRSTFATHRLSSSKTDVTQVVLRSDTVVAKVKQSFHAETESERARQLESFPHSMSVELGQPLIRVASFDCPDQETIYHLILSHTLCDGFSMAALMDDFDTLLQSGIPAQRPPWSHVVQHSLKQDDKLANDFWLDYLRHSSPASFPRGLSSGAYSTSRTQTKVIEGAHFEALADLDVTPSVALLAALSMVISIQSADESGLIGIVSSGREQDVDDIDRIVGPCLSTLPIKYTIHPQDKIQDILARLQTDLRQIVKHGHIGLAEIGKTSGSQTQLFNVLFNYQGDMLGEVNRDSQVQDLEESGAAVSYPLVIEAGRKKDTIDVHAHYDPDAISAQDVARLLEQLSQAMLSICQDPTKLYQPAIISSPQEGHCLINRWSGAESAMSYSGRTIVDSIRTQMENSPGRTAVEFENSSLTYHQLHKYAFLVAQALSQKFAGPGTFVAIMLHKTPALISSILGVLFTGAAYVPLDLSYPAERILFILNDVKNAAPNKSLLVITDEDTLVPLFTSSPAVSTVLEVECNGQMKTKSSEANPDDLLSLPTHIASDSIAVVLYTSGSTGAPKGVLCEHAQVMSFIEGVVGVAKMDNTTRFLQFSSPIWDVHVLDALAPLAMGGTVCLADPQWMLGPKGLNSVVTLMKITHAFLTPTVAAWLDDGGPIEDFQTLLVGGERLLNDLRNRLMAKVRLLHCWCPTECMVTVVAKHLNDANANISTLGWPIGSNVVYILDENLDPLPFGAIGELYVSGPQIARGYLGRPDLTKTVFLTDPFRPSRRMFKTGDLGRFSSDGIEFVGRMQEGQLKLRGRRVELGEVEAALRKASNRKDVFVDAVFLPGQSDINLTAFIAVSHSSSSLAVVPLEETGSQMLAQEIRNYSTTAASSLPSYMRPTCLLPLSHIPMTPSGKINRQAVRKAVMETNEETIALLSRFFYRHSRTVGRIEGDSAVSDIQPSTETERILQETVGEVLGISSHEIGVQVNWVELSLDSMGAVRLASKACARSLPVTVRDLVQNSSIQTLAALVDKRVRDLEGDKE